MAMERLLTSLVFCEAPGLDVVAYAGTSSSLIAAVKVSTTASPGGRLEQPVSASPAEAKKDGARKECFSGKAAPRWLQAAYEPAFDGLYCFETIVMH